MNFSYFGGTEMKLEEKLVSLRKANGLSQIELAEKMNVSRQAVSRWEVGASVPSIENLKFLSELYGVSIDWLINEETEEAEKKPQNTGHQLNKRRKITIWLWIILTLITLIVFGVFTHSIAISLAVAVTAGNILIIYLLVRWILHIVMSAKTNRG